MSGTSADGIDAVLVSFGKNPTIEDTEFLAYSEEIKSKIQQLQFNSEIGYHELASLNIELGTIAAELINSLNNRNPGKEIIAIGSHGQTVQHRPNHSPAYTLQIGSGAVITEKSNITTVNDFRARDIAMGGQGAPFAPLFHKAFFADKIQTRTIINIGGIANLSYLENNDNVIGFDTGPGNTLIDLVCRYKFNQSYDHQGGLAQTGKVNGELLQKLLSDPYFEQPPPKSTGQEYFNQQWLLNYLGHGFENIPPTDLLATVTKLTADSIAQSISRFCPATQAIYLCGGGTHNETLVRFLAQGADCKIETTQALGINPDWVEACGFAWLAKQAIEKKTVDLTRITGAKKPCILGCIWPVDG